MKKIFIILTNLFLVIGCFYGNTYALGMLFGFNMGWLLQYTSLERKPHEE